MGSSHHVQKFLTECLRIPAPETWRVSHILSGCIIKKLTIIEHRGEPCRHILRNAGNKVREKHPAMLMHRLAPVVSCSLYALGHISPLHPLFEENSASLCCFNTQRTKQGRRKLQSCLICPQHNNAIRCLPCHVNDTLQITLSNMPPLSFLHRLQSKQRQSAHM